MQTIVPVGAQAKVRLSEEAKQFIVEEAHRHGSSQSSEINRCVVERMDRLSKRRARRQAAKPDKTESRSRKVAAR